MSEHNQPAHLPTADEIRAACEAIRAGWSDAERRRRAPWLHNVEPVGPHCVAVAEIGVGRRSLGGPAA